MTVFMEHVIIVLIGIMHVIYLITQIVVAIKTRTSYLVINNVKSDKGALITSTGVNTTKSKKMTVE